MRITPQRDPAPASDPRWGFQEGDEIVPGRSALKRLGGGRRYDAYLTWDQHLHTVVVCKLVRPHLLEDAHTLSGLTGEWEMLQRLDHPVIVRGFDAVLDGPRPHIVLEHLEGPRLSTLVRRYGPLPIEQLVPLAIELAAAIHYLRAEDVVHLDLKPSNTIMGAPPRLIDLSVALTTPEAKGLTAAVGTDAYMAPEQCDPERLGPVGPAADVWGLGVTLFKAATGGMPFDRPELHAADGPERWPQLRQEPRWPDVAPDPLASLIMLCLERDPARRPEPTQLHSALEPILGGLPKPRLSRLKPRL
jgi:eukaryotic-like serine/threonine-protein kinase